MSMKGKGGKGGKAKGGGKNVSGGQTIEIKRSKARATASINEAILTLRNALFDEMGRNKDVTAGIAPAFMKYDRKGLDCTIEFAAKLSKDEVKWAFDLSKASMEETYDASGFGWDDADKLEQLQQPEARFLLVRKALPPEAAAPVDEAAAAADKEKETKKRSSKPKKGELVAFAHWRFSVQGEFVDAMAGEPTLVLWDLAIADDGESRRKGLGKHLLLILELIARKTRMRYLSVPVMNCDEAARAWITNAAKGFAPDASLEDLVNFDPAEEGFEVYTKELAVPTPAAAPKPAAAAGAPPLEGQEKEKEEGEDKAN